MLQTFLDAVATVRKLASVDLARTELPLRSDLPVVFTAQALRPQVRRYSLGASRVGLRRI